MKSSRWFPCRPRPALLALGLIGLTGLAGCTPSAPKHGTEYVLAVEPAEAGSAIAALPADALERTGKALKRRLELAGWQAAFEIVPPNLLRIRVAEHLTGSVTNLPKLLTRPGRLEFRLVHPDSEKLLAAGTVPNEYETLKEVISRPGGISETRPHLVAKQPLPGLTGHVQKAFPSQDASPGHMVINFQFDADGARAFGDVTTQNLGRQLAILLDGVLYSAPIIRSPITGGSAQISGSFKLAEARELAALLETALDWRIRLVEERQF